MVTERRPLAASAARGTARSRTRSSRRSTSPAAGCCSSGTASTTSRWQESYGPVGADWDYFHLNSIAVDSDENLLVSSRNTHTIYKIDRSGAIIWRLGGKHSDFAMGRGSGLRLAARRAPPARRHDHRLRQRRHPAVERLSRGLILDVDEQAMTATLLRQYTHPQILAGSQGNVQVLPNGNVFVGWGAVPHVSEFDRSGQLLFDALLGDEVRVLPRLPPAVDGPARRRPAIALAGRGARLTAYASWNGATDVAAWQLLAGRGRRAASGGGARARLRDRARTAAAAGPHFAVQALDAGGAPLGQSQTMTLTT